MYINIISSTAGYGLFHRRREQLQKEIDALTKEKTKLEATIKELRKQECTHRGELESTQNQIKESKAVLTQLTDELKTARERSISKQTTVHVSYCYYFNWIRENMHSSHIYSRIYKTWSGLKFMGMVPIKVRGL